MSIKIESEVKLDSDACLVAWDNQLIVATEDGSIKTFDANLTPGAAWKAHPVQIFALAAGNGHIYTSSNDGGVKVWSSTGEKIQDLRTAGADVGSLLLYGNELYIGDESGNVLVYEDFTEKARYNLLEEVKDIALSPPYLYTVRDLDITVTEIKPGDSKSRFATRLTFEGRAPLKLAGTRLFAMARSGNNLCLYDASVDTQCKKMHEVKVSDMIVTSLAVSGSYVWSGGWDGNVRCWKINNDQLEAAGEINLGSCVNALSASSDNIYACLTGGRVVRIKNN